MDGGNRQRLVGRKLLLRGAEQRPDLHRRRLELGHQRCRQWRRHVLRLCLADGDGTQAVGQVALHGRIEPQRRRRARRRNDIQRQDSRPRTTAGEHPDQRPCQHALGQHVGGSGDAGRDRQQERPVVVSGSIGADIDERRRAGCRGEVAARLADRRVGRAACRVLLLDDVEAGATQSRRDRVGGQQAGGQWRQRSVGAVADHQRHMRRCGLRREQRGRSGDTERRPNDHHGGPCGNHEVVASCPGAGTCRHFNHVC